MPHRPVDIHARFHPGELIALWREERPRGGGEIIEAEGNARRLLPL